MDTISLEMLMKLFEERICIVMKNLILLVTKNIQNYDTPTKLQTYLHSNLDISKGEAQWAIDFLVDRKVIIKNKTTLKFEVDEKDVFIQ